MLKGMLVVLDDNVTDSEYFKAGGLAVVERVADDKVQCRAIQRYTRLRKFNRSQVKHAFNKIYNGG